MVRPGLRCWIEAIPLVLCTLSWALAPLQTFALPTLAVPAAVWLAHRNGLAALMPISVMLLPMLVPVGFGPFATAGSAGLYLTALVAARAAADPGMRDAVLGADRPPGNLALFVILLVLPWSFASPWFAGVRLSVDLWFLVMGLLLATGMGRAPLRPVADWVVGAWLFGLVLRGLGFPVSGPLGFLGYGLGNPADLLTAFAALYGPRLLRERPPERTATLLLVIFAAALAARVRIVPGYGSLLGPVGPFTLIGDTVIMLLALAAAIRSPALWWAAPLAFAAARVPSGLLLPSGFNGPLLQFAGGGLLAAACQTLTVAAFARLGAARQRPRPVARTGAEGWPTLRSAVLAEARRGIGVLAVAAAVTAGVILAAGGSG